VLVDLRRTLSLLMPVTRPVQLLLGLGILLLVSFVLIHPSSSLSVPYSNFWSSQPTYVLPAVHDSENRHLTSTQCQARYPGLYYEADLAKAFYQKKGGISLDDVNKADEDGGASARLAIIDNKVCRNLIRVLTISFMSRHFTGQSTPGHTLLLRRYIGLCLVIQSP